jgi:aryl-alcohol dehydrogenase-like predicted oxidoreductase
MKYNELGKTGILVSELCLETMRGLEDVVRSGKVRHLGAGNRLAWMAAKANSYAEKG